MTTIIDQAPPLPATEIVSPLASRMLFWRSRYQQDSAALYHLPFLFWLVEVMRPRTTVTLGLGDGVAHFGLCQAVDKLGLTTRCQGVDEWPASPGTPAPAPAPEPESGGTVPAAIVSHNDANYAAFSVIEAIAPSTLLARLGPGSVDLLWVDAAMTAQMTDALIYAWPTKLSPNGVILLHGVTRHFASDAGQSLLAGFKAAHRTVFFPAGDGLLVVLWGPDQPYRLARLAEMDAGTGDADDPAEIQQIFNRLGLLHRLEWAAPQAQALAAEAQTARQAALAALEVVRQDHDALHKSYALRTNAAARHQAEVFDLRDRNAALEQAQTGMDALQQEIDRLRREISAGAQSAEDRSREIVTLTQALAGLHAEKTAALVALSKAGTDTGTGTGTGKGGPASRPKQRGVVHRIKASRMMSPVRRMVRSLKGLPPPAVSRPGPVSRPVSVSGPRPTLMQRIKRSRVMAPVRSAVRRYRSGR